MNASSAPAVPGQGSEVDPLTVLDPARWEADLRSMTRIVLRPIGSPALSATATAAGER